MADNELELMRYIPIPDMQGSATKSSGPAAEPTRSDWLQPMSSSNTNMQAVQQQKAYENVERSRWNAVLYGWNGTVLNGLYRTFTAPQRDADPNYSFDQKKQDVFNSDIQLSDDRAKRLFAAGSQAEVNDLLTRYTDEDAKAKSAQAYTGYAMLGSVPDIDLVVPFLGKAVSGTLRGASMTTKLMGLANTADRLEQAGKVVGMGANAMFGDVSSNRVWNAVANMGIGAGVTGLADAYSDEKVSWQQYATAIGLSGLAGAAFPAHAEELLAQADRGASRVPALVPESSSKAAMPAVSPSYLGSELFPAGPATPAWKPDALAQAVQGAYHSANSNLIDDVRSLSKTLNVSEMAEPIVQGLKSQKDLLDEEFLQRMSKAMRDTQGIPALKPNPEDLAKLTPEQFAGYGLRQIRDRMERAKTGWLEDEAWRQMGGKPGERFNLNVEGARAGLTPDAELFASDVQEFWNKLFPDSRLSLHIADSIDGAAHARGAFSWAGENTGRLQINSALLHQSPAIAAETMTHEIGHGVTIKLLSNALKNNDVELLRTYFDSFTKHITGLHSDVSGTLTPRDLQDLGERVAGQGSVSAKAIYNTEDEATLRRYYHSPLEWLAQQFTKSAAQVVKEARLGTGSAREAALKSALYRSMPEAVQDMLWSVIDKVRTVWDHFFKGKHDEAVPELHAIFENIAAEPRRMERYTDWEPTAAHVDSDGLKLPEWENGSPSLEGYSVEELSKPVAGAAEGSATEKAVASGPEVPYGPQALATPNSPKLLKWFEKHMGLGWYSVFANLNSRGGYLSGLAGMLVHDGAGRNAFSAAAYKRAAELELSAARAKFDNALADATGITGLGRLVQSQTFRDKYREIGTAVREDLMQKFDAFADGKELPVNPDPRIEQLSQLYAKTGYAKKSLNFQKTAGRFGSEFIDHNPWYVPMKMSSDSLRDLYRAGKANADDVKELLRLQVTKMFPGYDDKYMRQIAGGIYDGIIDRGMGRSAKKPFFEGTTLDELQQAMIRAGFDTKEMAGFLERFKQKAAERKRDSTLKARMDWDWTLSVPTSSGAEISMRDLVGHDLLKDMEAHQRSVSGQYGLGMVGFSSDSELNSAVEKAMQDYAERGAGEVDLKAARNLLDNVVDSLMGRSVGEQVPPLMRASSAISSAIVLKNPVFYMSVEAAAACEHLGAARFIKNAILPSGMLDGLKGLDKQSAAELQKALEGRYVAEGRWKPILTHFDDGYDILSSMDAAAYHIGAASKIINGTEHVRRKLTKTVLGSVISDLYRAARGDSKKAEFMQKFGATPELLNDIKAELDKHGVDGHELNWNPKTRAQAEVVLMNTVDQIIQANRLGEIPAFMQFSSVGKALLPFTSFIAGAYNKVFLKGLADNDGAGLAIMLAYQIAGGTMAEALKNTAAGRDPTDSGQRNFIVRGVTNSNVASWFGLMVDSATSPQAGGAVQFAFPRALVDLATHRDMKHLVNTTPLGVVPGVGILTSLADDSKQK